MKMMDAVSEEKNGFKYGEPQRLDQKSLAVILPILRITGTPRLYVTFPECQEKVLIFDTGHIDKMEADNQTDQNVFVRSGTLFKGATQERALQRSAVLFPREKSVLSVRCVHATRGINPNSKVSYGGVTPLAFDQKVYDEGYTPADQHTYWSSVTATTHMFNSMMGKQPQAKGHSHAGHVVRHRVSGQHSHSVGSPLKDYTDFVSLSDAAPIGAVMPGFMEDQPYVPGHDDLASHLDDFATNFDSLLSKLERQENQVGIGLITQDGVQTIEFFDHSHSWKALHESAIKRIGSHVISKADPSVFEYKPEAAKAQVNKVLGLNWKTKKIWDHQPSNGEPHVLITGLSAENFVGEAVEINRNLIHLVVLKKTA